MKSSDPFDLLIVGGGVLGSFFAFHGVARGMRVLLVDRHAAPKGATVRNFGQIVPSGLDNKWQAIGRESLAIYKSIQAQFDISVREQGSLYIASDDDELTLIQELYDLSSQTGYSSELWTPAQCRERYPQLRADYCLGGLFFPEEISVNPRVMIHRIHQYLAENLLFESRFQTCIQDLQVNSGGVRAMTHRGESIDAHRAIVCGGCEFQTLFPERFLQSDLQVVKLQMMRLKPQPVTGSGPISLPGNVLTGLTIRRYESFAGCPSWQRIKASESADSFAKQWGVHILFKQEPNGSIILGDSHQYASVREMDSLDFELRTDVEHFMLSEAKKIFDLPSWDIESTWAGCYCQTDHPEGIFTETVDEQIQVVTGIGGKGMTSSAGFTKHFLKEMLDD